MSKLSINWYLEIEEGGVRMTASKLEGAQEDADTNTNAIWEEEALAEVTDGVSNAGIVRVIAGRAVRPTRCRGATELAALELLNGILEPFFCLAKADFSGAIDGVGVGRWVGGWWRCRWRHLWDNDEFWGFRGEWVGCLIWRSCPGFGQNWTTISFQLWAKVLLHYEVFVLACTILKVSLLKS